MTRNDRPVFSPRARVVFRALQVAPGTIEDLARETKFPSGVVETALAELSKAGRVQRMQSGRWRAK